jgi:hypothetical protein
MTFEELLTLDDDALNRLIEESCYPEHQWRQICVANSGEYVWELSLPPPQRCWSTVPYLHHTASWTRTMALAWRYKIGLWPLKPGKEGWIVQLQHPGSCTTLAAETEDELRVRICQLAVWQMIQHGRKVVRTASQEAQDASKTHGPAKT